MESQEPRIDQHESRYNLAYAAIELAYVGLSVSTPNLQTYVFSGFFVAIGKSWFWITCEHVAQSIMSQMDGTVFAFKPVNSRAEVLLGHEDLSFVDVVGIVRSMQDNVGGCLVSETFLEAYDIAVLPIRGTVQSYLMNEGVVPFRKPATLFNTQIAQDVSQLKRALFVAGTPSQLSELESDSRTLNRFVILGAVPSKWEDPVLWCKPTWSQDTLPGSLDGMSGGPAVIATATDVYVIGVQSKQLIQGNRVLALGVVETMRLLENLRER